MMRNLLVCIRMAVADSTNSASHDKTIEEAFRDGLYQEEVHDKRSKPVMTCRRLPNDHMISDQSLILKSRVPTQPQMH
mgnify:CR=1 FL=1